MKFATFARTWSCPALLSVILLSGCGGRADHPAADPAPAEPEAAQPAAEETAPPAALEVSVPDDQLQAVNAVLSAADKVDGAEDHVVSRCPGCSLLMAGSADHAMKVAGHELHFCSSSCRDRFAENAVQAIAALEVPGA